MATNRDDFLNTTIEKLRSRVGNRCSNPDCRVPTTGPTLDPEKVNNIGVAAHITAAAPGGPRYNKKLTVKQRRSIINAIWLCSNCSRDIDNNFQKFSVKVLNKWKVLAEKKADNEIGTKLPDDNYVINSLSSALTGQSEIFLPKIIPNAHKATLHAMEKLDSRFTVKTKFDNGITHFELRANEKVTAQLKINPAFSKEFFKKYTNLENHGDKISIDSSAISIKGSPLLEKITNGMSGKFQFSPSIEKEMVIQIWLEDPDSSASFNFNDFNGKSVLGKKSVTSKGESLNGLLNMTIRFSIVDFPPTEGTFIFSLNLEKWDKQSLTRLPYFDKIYNLYNKINNGWILHYSLEIEGLKISNGCSADMADQEMFKQSFSHLNFIYNVKSISKVLGVPLVYDDCFEYNADFNLKIKEIYQIMSEGISLPSESFKGNATCNLEASDDLSNIKMIIEAKGKVISLKIEQVESDQIAPFNQQITLPKFSHRLTEVIPKIAKELDSIVPGELVHVEWKPTKNCKFIIEKL